LIAESVDGESVSGGTEVLVAKQQLMAANSPVVMEGRILAVECYQTLTSKSI
jgi:hypothetical protein